jgi:predicted ester cyclase
MAYEGGHTWGEHMYYEEVKLTEKNKARVRQFYEEFFNRRQREAIDEAFLQTYVHHTPEVPGEKLAYEEYREHMLLLARAFPRMKVSIEDQVAEGDKVTTRFRIYGVQEGDLPNIPSRGRQINVEVINIFTIRDGRIAEGWESYDSLDMAIQLGIAQVVSTLIKGSQEKGYFPEGHDFDHDYNV